MKPFKYLLLSFLVAAFFITGSGNAATFDNTPKTEFVKLFTFAYSQTVNVTDVPQFVLQERTEASPLPGENLWVFSEKEFTIVNPQKICEGNTSSSIVSHKICQGDSDTNRLEESPRPLQSFTNYLSDHPERSNGNLSRLC